MITVLTGTGFAQLITLFSAPILTRLYDPDQYGVYSTVAGICALAAVGATGRYESSIIIPTGEREATACLKLSLRIAGFVSVGLLLLVTIAGGTILKILGLSVNDGLLYAVPMYTLFGGAYQAGYAWLVRTGSFAAISVGRIGAAAVSAVVALGIGLLHPDASGMVAGLLAGQAFACILFLRNLDDKVWGMLGEVTRTTMWSTAIRFRRFPLYAVPADLCNAATQQMPAILLLTQFGPGAAGLYALTQRMFNLPISLLSSSILDVFKKRAADDLAAWGECRGIFLKTMLFLGCLALIPLGAILFAAPPVFRLAFGPEWERSGVFAQILAPMFFFRFVASPLTCLLYLTERQRLDLAGNVAMLAVSSAGIFIGAFYHSVELGLAVYSGGGSLMYAVYLVVSYQCARNPNVRCKVS
jgi:O-antigen/teichoic acid export membrane protein